MPTTDLLVGSYPALPQQSITVTTAGPVAEAVVVPSNNYYLYDDSSPFDLLSALAAAIESHSVLSGVSAYFVDDLRIQIVAGANFSLSWPTDGLLRSLLGFTGNLSGSNVYTAPNVSPLVWSGGRRATYEARLGTDGIPVHDTAIGQAGTGVVRATSFNSYRRQEITWRYVANARVWTPSEAGGEFFAFWRDVLRTCRRFKVWRGLVEGVGAVSWDVSGDGDGVLPSSGAYVYAPPSKPIEMPWAREFALVESLHPISIPCVTAPEFEEL